MAAQRLEERVGLYGLLAEFSSPSELIRAIEACRENGLTKIDAFTPYPIEEVIEALGHHRSRLPLLVLLGGLAGLAAGFGLQYWSSVYAYAMNVGGRPLNSWIAFIPVTFETTILFASAAAVFGMLWLNGLPKPYHPVFNAPRFALASRDRLFLCVEAEDPRFDREATRQLLQGFTEVEVAEVEN